MRLGLLTDRIDNKLEKGSLVIMSMRLTVSPPVPLNRVTY